MNPDLLKNTEYISSINDIIGYDREELNVIRQISIRTLIMFSMRILDMVLNVDPQ